MFGLRLPAIDAFSFWLGFAVAAALAYLLYRFRHIFAEARQGLGYRLRGLREVLTSGFERQFRDDVLRYAQTAHLAGALFALDEILLPPRVWPLPPAFDPTAPPPDLDLNSAIPVLPDWPGLAALYGAPSLSVAEALAGGSHLLVLGPPGTGKTTLLAHLASRVAQGDTSLLDGEFTPVFIHAADLALPLAAGANVGEPLIAAAQARSTPVRAARLPRHLRVRLREYRCAIFLDGLDEVSPEALSEIAGWLAALMREFPQHRLVLAGGLAGFGPLLPLQFAPVHIAPWDAAGYRSLIAKWAAAWDKAASARRKRTAPDTDPHLIMGWLASGNQGRTIFEVSLKTWAAFAGDARGKRPWDWAEAYVLRHGIKPVGQRALARLAAALMDRTVNPSLTRAEAVTLLAPLYANAAGQVQMEPDEFLDDAIARRLLARHRDRVSFSHALAGAHCAATAMAAEPEATLPDLSDGWARAVYFYAPVGDLSPLVARRLGQTPDLLHTDLLACARWLRDTPPEARWRIEVLRRLSKLLGDPNHALPLRARAVSAFVAAGDPTVAALFKQHLTGQDSELRQLSALGLGALDEVSAIRPVSALFADPHLEVRWAAALALSVLSHASAVEELAKGLLAGDDMLRKSCAEALARHPEEGHPVLQEAIQHENLSVRRAAVYGLAATRTDWALALLESVQHREQEWFVRSAAQEKVAEWHDAASRAPRPFAPPEKEGWLVAWAAERGMGVPPGRGAIEIINRALVEGDEPTRRAAAGALGRLGDPNGARDLYALLRDPSTSLRQAGFEALTLIGAAAGQRMAAPI